jgi:hypothetical protein
MVCIEDYDHHCVFFSKCIGGGNLKCFWGSMAMLLVNFVLVATMVAFAAFYESELDKKTTEQQSTSSLKFIGELASR